jgi:hypothetical protein
MTSHRFIKCICHAARLVGVLLLTGSSLALATPLLSVQTETADLRAGPGAKYSIVTILQKGDNLTPLTVEGEFIQVKVASGGKAAVGKTGWIYAVQQGWGVQYVLTPSQIDKPLPAATQPQAAISPSASAPPLPLPASALHGPDLAYTDLEELGLVDGHVFEGVRASHAQTFWFTLPQELAHTSGQLRVHYLASPTLSDYSLIRIDVNSIPRYTGKVALDGRDAWISVPLSAADLQAEGHLGITIHASLVVNENRCFGELLPSNFLHLLPDTAITLDLPGRAESLQGGWELLPKQVKISVTGQLDEARYSNALMLGMNLVEMGKEVEFVTFPAWGDIMIVPREELAQLIYDTYHATPELQKIHGAPKEYLSEKQNIAYINLPDRGILTLTDANAELPAALSSWEWMQLAKEPGYRLRYANPQGDLGAMRERDAIPLGDLNPDLIQPRYVADKTDWRLVLTPRQLPPDTQLDRLEMSVTSAPSDGRLPPLFYVYLNNVLQQAVRLSNDGTASKFVVFLSNTDQHPSRNYLSFVVQRSDQIGDCFGPQLTYPAQINPESVLKVRNTPRKPEQFIDLPAYFSSKADIYLPQAMLSDASESLRFLSNLMYNNHYTFDHRRMHFYAPQDKLTFDKPFILLGQADAGLDQTAVEFDKGRVKVTDYLQQPLLDLSERGDITVFQLVRAKQVAGLWIMPPENRPLNFAKPLVLINDDVAFADAQGVLLTLNTQQRRIAAVEYPEYQNWFALLGKYKFWLMGAAWFLLTLLGVHLYNQAAGHKRASRDTAE